MDRAIRIARGVAAAGTVVALLAALVMGVGSRTSRSWPDEMMGMTEAVDRWQIVLFLTVLVLPLLLLAALWAPRPRAWVLAPAVPALAYCAARGWQEWRAALAERARPGIDYVVIVPETWPVAVVACAIAAVLLTVVIVLGMVEVWRERRPSTPLRGVTATAPGR